MLPGRVRSQKQEGLHQVLLAAALINHFFINLQAEVNLFCQNSFDFPEIFRTLIDFALLPLPLESHALVAGVKFAARTSQTSTPFAANNELWMLRSCKPRPPRFGYRAHPVYTFGECET